MRIDLNLATRPFVNRTPQLLLLGLLGTLGVGLTAWNLSLWLRSQSEQHAVESQLRELRKEEDQLKVRRGSIQAQLAKVDLKPLTLRVVAANAVLAQKSVSWSLLLQRLEQVLPWSAALKSIHTTVSADAVKLQFQVRAKTYDDALEFLDSLEKSPCFQDAYPRSEISPKAPSGEYEMFVDAAHDPWCGQDGPLLPGSKGSGLQFGRRGSRG